MKKRNKIIIIIAALIIFSGMFFGVQKLQSSVTNNSLEASQKDKKSDIKKDEKQKEDSTEKNNSITPSASASATLTPTPTAESTSQPKETSDNSKNDTSSNNVNTSSQGQSASNAAATAAPAASAPTAEAPRQNNQAPNFIIKDMVNNTTILQKYYDDYDNISVAQLALNILDKENIKYRVSGAGTTTYFVAIAGLKEKDAGDMSGWCYYIKKSGSSDFVKPNVGAGGITYHKGDVVEWRYWKDAINQK